MVFDVKKDPDNVLLLLGLGVGCPLRLTLCLWRFLWLPLTHAVARWTLYTCSRCPGGEAGLYCAWLCAVADAVSNGGPPVHPVHGLSFLAWFGFLA